MIFVTPRITIWQLIQSIRNFRGSDEFPIVNYSTSWNVIYVVHMMLFDITIWMCDYTLRCRDNDVDILYCSIIVIMRLLAWQKYTVQFRDDGVLVNYLSLTSLVWCHTSWCFVNHPTRKSILFLQAISWSKLHQVGRTAAYIEFNGVFPRSLSTQLSEMLILTYT